MQQNKGVENLMFAASRVHQIKPRRSAATVIDTVGGSHENVGLVCPISLPSDSRHKH
ncbi:hypothetical protein FQA47_015374 [Oryzias melastigma]|uniref:Uncharacterized protein n=1 Tax=Oryzias melastigma TaxID=30732 RepID=A0A834C5W6_ORYME|nr:hypothetical protein FQA47_015374 [Oryzias melastigma]